MRLTERELFNKTHRPPARPSVPPQHGPPGHHGPPGQAGGRHQPSTSGQANHSSGHHHNNDLPNGQDSPIIMNIRAQKFHEIHEYVKVGNET